MKFNFYLKLLIVPVLLLGFTTSVEAQFGKNNNWFYYPGVSPNNVKRATTIRKTDTPPTIDGQIDDVWNTVPWNPAQYYSPRDAMGAPGFDDAYMEWKGLWDDNTYYLLIHVVDDAIVYDDSKVCLDFSCGWWNMDGIELYGNPTNDDLPAGRDTPPNHWVKLFADQSGNNVMVPHVAFEGYPAQASIRVEQDEEGLYHIYYEYQDAPWETQLEGFAPEVGGKMRIELQLQDNDGTEEAPENYTRDVIVSWADSTDANDTGAGAAGFGEVTFGDETDLSDQIAFGAGFGFRQGVSSVTFNREVIAKKVTTAPVIDGEYDEDVWNDMPWNSYQIYKKGNDPNAVDTPPAADDFWMEWKAVWDDETVYFLIHVADDTLSYKPEGNWWWQDAIEFYVRGDGSPAEAFSRGNNAHTVWHVLHPSADNPGFVQSRDTYGSEIGLKIEEGEDGLQHAYWEYKDIAWAEQLAGTATAPMVGDSIRFSIMVNEDDDAEAAEDTERDYIALAASTDEARFDQATWPVLIMGNEEGKLTGGGGPSVGYTGTPYAGASIGSAWTMPGPLVNSETGVFVDSRDFSMVDLKLFDVAGDLPDLQRDSGMVFGINQPPVNDPGDPGGQDIRGYDTKSNADSAVYYTPIRYNGGAQVWRQGGNWVRYTVNMPAGTYHFVYRADVRGFAANTHKFDLNIYEPNDLNSPIYSTTIDLTGDFPGMPNDFKSGAINLGGGNDLTDWFRILDDITIEEEGDYVVELNQQYFPFTSSGVWGGFTFNLASDAPEVEVPYPGKGYAGGVVDSVWTMPGPDITEQDTFFLDGTVDVREFDVVSAEGPDLAQDTAIVFGIYPPSVGQNPGDAGGQDVHGYNTTSDSTKVRELYQPIRFNNGALVWRGSGKWTRYTVNFQAGEYNYVYRGDVRGFTQSGHKYQIKIYDPNNIVFPIYQRTIDLTSGFPANQGDTTDGVENIGGGNNQTDWLRLNESIFIPEAGNYIVEIDEAFFTYSSSILGEFSFEGVNITNTTEVIAEKNIKVYPNPTSGQFTVESLDGDLEGRMDFFTMDGRLIETRRNVKGLRRVTFETNGLTPGMYLIRLVNGHTIQTARVLVNK